MRRGLSKKLSEDSLDAMTLPVFDVEFLLQSLQRLRLYDCGGLGETNSPEWHYERLGLSQGETDIARLQFLGGRPMIIRRGILTCASICELERHHIRIHFSLC